MAPTHDSDNRPGIEIVLDYRDTGNRHYLDMEKISATESGRAMAKRAARRLRVLVDVTRTLDAEFEVI